MITRALLTLLCVSALWCGVTGSLRSLARFTTFSTPRQNAVPGFFPPGEVRPYHAAAIAYSDRLRGLIPSFPQVRD